jgi:phenylacetate-CoA ligase
MALTPRGEYYDDLETMTPQQRETYLNEALARHVRHACEHAPAAKKLFASAGIAPDAIRTVKDLEKLPVTRKPELIEMQRADPPYGGVAALPIEDVQRVFISPGPIYEIQPPEVAWFAKSFRAAGFRRGDVAINTFTYHLSPAGILFHEAVRACGATVVVAGTGNTDLQIQIMRDLKVTGFVGTPSYLMTVIERTRAMGLDFRKDFSVEKAWFTGEMLAPSLRLTFENDYGIDTYQAYAVTEPGGAIAYECKVKAGMHLMDEYITEIVDPETGKQLGPGEVGEIVVTPVCNPDWGLVRFGTGDLSSYYTEPCPCGRTANRIAGIVGRAGDAVKVRGMFIVATQARDAILDTRKVARYRLVVGREQHRDSLTLRIELNDPADDTPRFKDDLNTRFQGYCRIKIDAIEVVAPGTIAEDAQGIQDVRKWD